jgi:hypothetical protein
MAERRRASVWTDPPTLSGNVSKQGTRASGYLARVRGRAVPRCAPAVPSVPPNRIPREPSGSEDRESRPVEESDISHQPCYFSGAGLKTDSRCSSDRQVSLVIAWLIIGHNTASGPCTPLPRTELR